MGEVKREETSAEVMKLVAQIYDGRFSPHDVLTIIGACLDKVQNEDFEVGLTLAEVMALRKKTGWFYEAVTGFALAILESVPLMEALGIEGDVIIAELDDD